LCQANTHIRVHGEQLTPPNNVNQQKRSDSSSIKGKKPNNGVEVQ